MKNRPFAVVAALLLAAVTGTAAHGATPSEVTGVTGVTGVSGAAAGAAAVRSWNAVSMTTIVASATPVPEQPLHLAAVHRAVVGAVRVVRHREGRASVLAAIGAAAHDVLVSEFPSQQGPVDDALARALADVPAGSARASGLAIGHAAAVAALAERADDGRDGPIVAVPPPAPGVWSPTPPNVVGISSWLGGVRPFALATGSAVRPAGPPALAGKRWARDYNETRIYGSATSTARTATQTEVARFWSDPPLVQNQRALRDYAEAQGLGVLETARLFALADSASADALIACFDAKYHFEFWRPVRAIPDGDSDGNAATPADPGWAPLLPTPNFPEYPSAHSCSTTAIATVVAALAPTHRLDFTITSVATGTAHHFGSVRQLTTEVGNARVWGGLHWRFATEDGARVGRAAALAVLARARCHSDG